jgi:hypothetical protein
MYFTFRELETENELLQALRLRYRVMRDSHLQGLCPENRFGIDLDGFDFSARHFGLYSHKNGSTTLIGCQRGVYPAGEIVNKMVSGLISRFAHYSTLLLSHRLLPLPCLEYMPPSDGAALVRLYMAARREKKNIGESTRLLIDPRYASAELAGFLGAAVIGVYMLSMNLDIGIAIVAKYHKRFYRRFGFRTIEGTRDRFYDKPGMMTSCMEIRKEYIPAKAWGRLAQMADAFQRTGRICYDPAQPDSFTKPWVPAAAGASPMTRFAMSAA